MKKVMRYYEVDKGDFEKIKSRYDIPEKAIRSAMMRMQITPVTEVPKETAKIRIYLSYEEFKTLDKKAKVAGASSASIIRGIAAYLASNEDRYDKGGVKVNRTSTGFQTLDCSCQIGTKIVIRKKTTEGR